MRPFEKADWYGNAGAEEAPGKPPMIGSKELGEGKGLLIVADINGIGIDFFSNNDITQQQAWWWKTASYETSMILSNLIESTEIPDLPKFLEELGFEQHI